MSVDRTGLWVLLAVCCAAALLWEARRRRRVPPPASRAERIERIADTVLTGLGLGMAAAFALSVLAITLEALGL